MCELELYLLPELSDLTLSYLNEGPFIKWTVNNETDYDKVFNEYKDMHWSYVLDNVLGIKDLRRMCGIPSEFIDLDSKKIKKEILYNCRVKLNDAENSVQYFIHKSEKYFIDDENTDYYISKFINNPDVWLWYLRYIVDNAGVNENGYDFEYYTTEYHYMTTLPDVGHVPHPDLTIFYKKKKK